MAFPGCCLSSKPHTLCLRGARRHLLGSRGLYGQPFAPRAHSRTLANALSNQPSEIEQAPPQYDFHISRVAPERIDLGHFQVQKKLYPKAFEMLCWLY